MNADGHDRMADVVTDLADLHLNRPVGERFEYANLNSVVIAAVIEAVTGESWQDYVRSTSSIR